MKQTPSNPNNNSRALNTVLRNTAISLDAAEQLVTSLEDAFFTNSLQSPAPSHEMGQLQAVDMLSQTLGEISALLGRIAAELAPDVLICHDTIIAPVKLEALRKSVASETAMLARRSFIQGKPTTELF